MSTGATFPLRALLGLTLGFALAAAAFHAVPHDPTALLPPPPTGEDALADCAGWETTPAPGELRIAVVGASLTAGFPYAPTGAASYATLLGAGATAVLGTRVDVRASARAAQDSGGIAARARALLRLRPHVLCVTLGSNENGPRIFAERELVPARPAGWLADHASRFRAWLRWLPRTGPSAGGGIAAADDPRAAVLRRLHDARPGQPVLSALPVSFADQDAIVDRLRRTLRALADEAAAAGVALVLCIAPDDLAGSWPRGMTAVEPEIDAVLRNVTPTPDAALLERTAELLLRWPDRADLHFAHGQLRRARGDEPGARFDLELARDLDPVPLRVTSRIARGIAEEARLLGCPCIHLEHALGSPIPDPALFLDHGHLTEQGHVRAAAHLAQELAGAGLLPALPAGWRDRFEAAAQAHLARAVEPASRQLAAARMDRSTALLHVLFGSFRDALPRLHRGLLGLRHELPGPADARFAEWTATWVFCVAAQANRLAPWTTGSETERAVRLRRTAQALWDAAGIETMEKLAEGIRRGEDR